MIETFVDGLTKEIAIENGKALSCLCKHILLSGKKKFVTVNDVASALGITPQSFRNKLTRNSFSVNDLLIIADMVGSSIQIHTAYDSVISLELKDFLDDDTYNRYKEYIETGKRNVFNEILEMSKSLTEDELEQLITAYKDDKGSKNE